MKAALNITVSGTNVDFYQYKVGPSLSTFCNVNVGYISDTPSSNPILETLTGFADGSLTLCVLGKDSAGNIQSYENATSYTWIKDTIVPTISSVSSNLANGAYKTGTQVDLSIVFSKVVLVNAGTPSLDLNSGNGAKANYLSGNNSNTLVFRYTVGSGDSSTDLNYPLTTSLVLNGATIRDSTGNDANLSLPLIGGGNDLGSLKNIYIDTTAPNPPTGLAGGTWWTSTSLSPTLTFTSGTDGQSGLASHEVKIYDTTATSDVTTFATITSGSSISGH